MDRRPGLHRRRLTDLMRAAIDRCELDLSGLTVLTEAASGAYVVTPVIAAMAGANVVAVTKSTRYGSADEIRTATMELAGEVGRRIEIVTWRTLDHVSRADIVTNSGHVRPIDAEMIASMKRGAVLSLMYEAWEYRPEDLDLAACHARQVLVAATNERHPNVDVFSFLGPMAVRLMHDAGVSAYRSSVLLLCDNPFQPFLEAGLSAAGARVETVERVADARGTAFDAVVVSLTPRPDVVLTAEDARVIARRWPGAVVGQFWGDVDRAALAGAGVPVWAAEAPGPGHMGILLSDLGPEPIVRLQSGGLKAAESLWRQAAGQADVDLAYVEVMHAPQGATCHELC